MFDGFSSSEAAGSSGNSQNKTNADKIALGTISLTDPMDDPQMKHIRLGSQ
ncbi:hypothetical protein [Mesorhizobium sp. AA22]|uniref:hypothetical protein n=1 Tax=Mesorhizobium sp. AA22 TaxID=1854057 RepID=UPI0012EA3648|nr:hypothetical protein [Mesorhizobium sp. AA22]